MQASSRLTRMTREYKQQKEKVDRKRTALRSFVKDWQASRDRIKGPVDRPVNNDAPKRVVSAAKKKGLKVYPSKLPDRDISQADLKELCPPGGYIWTGHASGTFQAHFKPWPRISRSWNLCGSASKAGIECVKYLWDRWCVANSCTRNDVPIKGLLP